MWLIVAALVLSNVALLVVWLCRGTCACGAAALHDCEVCHDDKQTAARYGLPAAGGEVCKMNSFDWT